ncbi:phosphoglycerate kinase [Candidatus Contubernalis alkaliaceticus]|uniref:phosphoglycerate kinase n=1 Tax=Candidatus Contubernalis alkaliaceticus TaxID=338645 RepID=UPI001F4BE248|nr:phosphoglycerate kinase [Candidatus Contubernalis alkalaceticus]UNC90791.1 phosphoglycerate kinase [Candidatus Contubernalis alkalaceticus]
MNKVSVKDLDVKGKRVLLRVDLNVSINKDGEIIEENKIRSSLPTIQYLVEQGALVIIASHLGRPKGQVVEELRMDPVAKKLAEMLGMPVYKTDNVVGEEPLKALDMLKNGDILMLENIRFHPGETINDPQLAKEFARLADFYVNDAFGTCHRAHASTVGVAELLPSAAGLNMEKEISVMSKVMENPERPLVAILGGTKVADKIGLITHFIDIVDVLLIGGGMANTFLKAKGYQMGKSFVEEDKVEAAKEILAMVEGKKAKFVLPVDFIAASEASENSDQKVVAADSIPSDWMALDIGLETVDLFQEYLDTAKTVIWNGPLGMFEIEDFAQGTVETAHFIADLEAVKVIGGGDVVAAVERAGVADRMTHISTGGGAALEFWEGKELPALSVLPEKVKV